jgi:hypothetical protein
MMQGMIKGSNQLCDAHRDADDIVKVFAHISASGLLQVRST